MELQGFLLQGLSQEPQTRPSTQVLTQPLRLPRSDSMVPELRLPLQGTPLGPALILGLPHPGLPANLSSKAPSLGCFTRSETMAFIELTI